ncbi:hypothetical protein U8591_05265 [Aquirufa antheringensis]
MVSGEWWMVESPGANFKEQSSNGGIACGDEYSGAASGLIY